MKVKIVANNIAGSFDMIEYYSSFIGKEVYVISTNGEYYEVNIPSYNGIDKTTKWKFDEVKIIEE